MMDAAEARARFAKQQFDCVVNAMILLVRARGNISMLRLGMFFVETRSTNLLALRYLKYGVSTKMMMMWKASKQQHPRGQGSVRSVCFLCTCCFAILVQGSKGLG